MDRIYYRLNFADPTQLHFYNLDRWLARPADLLSQYLAFEVKGTPKPKITLLNFEQIFENPESAGVLVRLRVSAQSPHGDAARLEQEFLFQHACPSLDAKGAVSGFSALLPEIQRSVQNWIDQNQSDGQALRQK